MSMGIHDPLTLNLRRQTTALLSKIPPSSQYAIDIQNASSTAHLLAILSKILAAPALTLTIAALYRPILYDLSARWLEDQKNTEEQLVALSLLIEVHEELFPILHRLLLTPAFKEGPLAFIIGEPSPLSIDISRLDRLLLAYYRILQANRELPHYMIWPLTPLSLLIWTPYLDNGARLLAIRCYALQSGMGEAEREKMERKVLGEICGVDCQLDYGQSIDGSRKEVDGWIMPVIELERVRDMRQDMVSTKYDYFTMEEGNPSPPINASDLCPLVANVHGIFLLRSHAPQQDFASSLITTPTTLDALQSIAAHLSLRLPVLLTSPPSSGKSLFLSHLAHQLFPGTKNHVITIHLADTSLDPRALLGSYASSSTRPGTFEWKEGVLIRSMHEGKWVVFEDIDRGSNEVLGVIKPLVESLRLGKWIGGRASLDVPSRGRVVAHDNFALFATRSINPSRTGTFPPPVFFGAHKFHEVLIPAPSTEELKTILNTRFGKLAGGAILAIIRLWESIRALGPAASVRNIGLRELEKFCTRIERLLPVSYQPRDMVVDPSDSGDPLGLPSIFPNPTLREDMYLEARDVFFGAGTPTVAARAHIDAIASTIGEHLGLDADRRQWVLHGRTPEFDLEKDVNGNILATHIGRTRLPARSTKLGIATPVMRPFAMHKPAILLLSRIATALSFGEPVLLTGETGTGKTSAVTHLAGLLRRPLVSLNLSHQTESSDLLGGFKPIDARIPGAVLQQRFMELFGGTFSRRKNEKFEGEVRRAVVEGRWKRAVGLWKESGRMALERIRGKEKENAGDELRDAVMENPRKRRKVEESGLRISEEDWVLFMRDVEEFQVQHVQSKGKFAFGFVEGPLVKALRSGDWVLLDEINLASSETLECISGLLHSPTASITLTEQGSLESVPRHPDFRLFACMNPATDVGKKDLSPNIRSRFTEIDVPPPDADKDTLLSIVTQYIGASAVGDKGAIMNVAEFYAAVKDLAEKRQIADGSNHRPHFSMRTLARALTFASDTTGMFGLRRAIWEGCLMAFTMVLDAPGMELVTSLAQKHLLVGVRNPRSMLMKEPSPPQGRSSDEFIKFGPFYLEKGPLPEDPVEDYIMTPSVQTKLIDLARIILTRRFPILIEGPTSSGKTSSVEYLAKRTGHRFIRINNHEHTDIQEYIGSYVSDPLTGKLVFKDGLLVRALRNGDWIVLDELNLAPTDVLEALNRLLDDNRELVIPETQEVVRPHPHFMLFATQNPPGLYAGRKVLSRAFRNRFLEVHFEDVPQVELETILCQRCQIAPSYGKKIVNVFHELQKRRQSSRVFESKQGFATLRDLFRWAGRDAIGYQELADNGYMLLAERARRADDKAAVKEVIESVMNVRIDERAMYNLQNPVIDFPSFLGCPPPSSSDVVWTGAMRRLFILVARALRFNEPVLLVGETGSGKTSVCQVFAQATSQRLHGLNCHQNTETADLIGGLRPVRNRSMREAEVFREAADVLQAMGIHDVPLTVDALASALNNTLKSGDTLPVQDRSHLAAVQTKLLRLQSIFQWYDGPLVEAMRNGDVFLLDEISLADDSVLERLNSVLEPARTIVLAERGGDDLEYPAIQAVDNFKLVATMNPGGDYGKKELSPALRNRFTEIWVPPVEDRLDLELIVSNSWKYETLKPYTSCILDFTEWLCARVGDRSISGLRDILAWVGFMNSVYEPGNQECIPPRELFHHAAHMTFLDGLGSLPQLSTYSRDALQRLKDDASSKLLDLVPLDDRDTLFAFVPVYNPVTSVQFGSFAIPKVLRSTISHTFNLQAPTTRDNAMRVVRACQVRKPILLEGSPGVGKTSLITALANISGHQLCRINLSDQTDLIDLFGSDLPVEGGGPGEFAWKDAEFLKALQEGHWVLLDEMNLAPQAVLEGLNAVLDHRGTVYIPELGRSFTRHPSFRIFAAQNPLNQGGGRKGLPKSFVNRFTKVYIEELSPSDLLMICQHIFPDLDEDIVKAMISFNMHLHHEVGIQHSFAREGIPWEFNLRDVIRWGTLLRTHDRPLHPVHHLRTVYLHRFRTENDRSRARILFDKVFSMSVPSANTNPYASISQSHVQIGHFTTTRKNLVSFPRAGRILKMHLSTLESIGHCVLHSWLSILTGQRNSGKTEAVRLLAHFTGNKLQEVPMNSATDTMDILGSFEQADMRRQALNLVDEVLSVAEDQLRSLSGSHQYPEHTHNLRRARNDSVPPQSLLRMASPILANMQPPSETTVALSGKINVLLDSLEVAGRFEWVDGPLVQAMKLGHWLLLDGANLCNPSVLDRLNPLCEPDGFLTLSERGYDDGKLHVLKPHPSFRLFMTVDPQHGELSRAMRNRGTEIAFTTKPRADDLYILSDFCRLPSLPRHARSPYIAFDAVRRGILSHADEGSHSKSSTGRSLDQESGLSTLVDQAPMIVVSSSKTTGITDAHLFFFARTVAPAYLPQLNRFLTSILPTSDSSFNRLQALLNTFPAPSLVAGSKHFWEARSASLGRSFELVCTQPMSFSFTGLPTLRERLSNGISTTHCMLLQELDLAVMIYLDEEDKDRMPPSDVGKHNERDNSGQALRQIAAVLAAMNSLGCKMLDSLDSHEWATKLEDIKLMLTLLQDGRHLRRTMTSDTFDFSAVQAITRWITDSLENCSSAFMSLATQARALSETVSLSSGLGLTEIWSAFFIDELPTSVVTELGDLEKFTSALQRSADTSLRRQSFDFMALRSLPASISEAADLTLLKLGSELERRLLQHQASTSREGLTVDLTFLAAELTAYEKYTIPEVLIKFLKNIIDLACTIPGPMLRLISYQHLIWTIQAGKNSVPIMAKTQTQWLRALWNLSSDHLYNGPSILLQPIELDATFKACDWKQNSLRSFQAYEERLSRRSRLALLQCEHEMQRIDQLSAFLHQSISLIAACFAPSVETSFLTNLRSLKFYTTEASMVELLVLLQQNTNTSFKLMIEKNLRPLCGRLKDLNTRPKRIAGLGVSWIAVANLIIDLFVPDAPIDPVVIQNSTIERWRFDQEMLSAQLSLHRQLEEILTGDSDSDFLDYLSSKLHDVAKKLSAAPRLPVRKDVSRLHMFWSEVKKFYNHILLPSKIEGLIMMLLRGEESAIQREQVLQQSMAGFCQRLDTVYSDYADLTAPLHLAILHMRVGLRLVAHSNNPGTDATSRTASALVAFPSVRSSAILCTDASTAGPSGVAAFSRLLLTLAAIDSESSSGISIESQMDLLHETYEQALRLWLVDRAKEKEMNEASQSLYRRKNLDHGALSEAQIEEQELRALFPSFDEDLDPISWTPAQPESHRPLVHTMEMQQLVAIHNRLFAPSKVDDGVSIDFASFGSIRRSALELLVSSNLQSLPDTLDMESLSLQLSLLHDSLSELQSAPRINGKPYDFYTDANVLEAKKAASMAIALKDRLESLIEEWPDQMVLHHLRSRCDAVLDLDLHSPVAKILAALEQLLLQTEDWETYANRDSTLKPYQRELIGLIVEWRRMELSCWQVLLDSQARIFVGGASEWWFRLYDAAVRGPLDACVRETEGVPESLTQYLNSLIPLLDDFIRSSSLGQFHARIRLLQSFDIYLQYLVGANSGNERIALHRVRRVLHATEQYYGLFSTQLSTHLSAQRGMLEQEIRDLIKLASWRDVNVQALKQSAQRTHHQLYKIIRKFRDLLRQPIIERLRPELANVQEMKELPFDPYFPKTVNLRPLSPDSNNDGKPLFHQLNLRQTLARFASLLTTRVQPFIHSGSAYTVDNLAVDIIVIAKELAAIAITSDLSKERREKQHKAVLVRKRKAWSDLLKELKRAGLSPSIKPEVLHQQTDLRWLREQPVMSKISELAPLLERSENYFTRLCGCLPEIRSSVSNHHSDLTTRELQRGIMLLESGFSLAVDLRSRLADALSKFRKLEQTATRLHMLSSFPKLSVCGSHAREQVIYTKDLLCRLSVSIQEIQDGMKVFNGLQPKQAIPHSVIEEIRALCASTKDIQDRFSVVVQNVELSSLPFLLENECGLIFDVRQHVIETSATLRHWSQADPRLDYLLRPVEQWLSTQDLPLSLPQESNKAPSPSINEDLLINSLLVTVQTLISKCPEPKSTEAEGEKNDQYILQGYRVVRDFTHLLNIDTIISGLDGVMDRFASHGTELDRHLRRILPFLDHYLDLIKDQLTTHSQWTKALFKLDIVICSVLHTLSTQGFCKPPDLDDSKNGEDAAEGVEGVGLGEGSGSQNVSKDIEDESQVEGLQGEEEQDATDNKDNKCDNDAIEMSDDFGGDMEDVPDSGSQDGEGSDQESEADPEERLGNLDSTDPSAIDEKLWGDEHGPDDDHPQEKTGQDHSEKRSGDSEVAAKEGNERPESKEQPSHGEEANDEKTSDVEDEPITENVGDDDASNDPEVSGAPIDDYVPDANALDLPDDMNLDKDDKELGGDLPEDIEVDEEEPVDDAIEDGGSKSSTDDAAPEQQMEAPLPDNTPEHEQDTEMPSQLQEIENNPEAEATTEENAIARPDVSTGDGVASPSDPSISDGRESASGGQAGPSVGAAAEDVPSDDKQKDEPASHKPNDEVEHQSATEPLNAGSAAAGPQDGQARSQSDRQPSSNPLRSLGDALTEIQRKFGDILSGEQSDAPREHTGDTSIPSQVEYLHPEDADYDMQALGPAGDEQVAKLDDLNIVDERNQVDETMPMDVDLPLEPETHELPSRDVASQPEPRSVEQREDTEGAILRTARSETTRHLPLSSDPSTNKIHLDIEENLEQTVEAQLREWQTLGFPDADGENIWRLYESLTHDLAYALCEQLRLILEPTLATRLKGDYRTGKRLNMKKIISYIASDYTKDKIWLRRTKPSQREYQVLIAIDDSRSMAESHSVHLAYETLALVSTALRRLESGEIAVAKFGESVDILHDLDDGPFTDQSGTKVISSFRFNQKATNVLSLVDTSLKVLENARERRSMSSATAADLWQLEIIISDGMCQDHDRLRTVLRKAEEERVMIVFIIIDSLLAVPGNSSKSQAGPDQGSILTMDKAEFKNVDGRMELQLQKYLDSFPFEYYVVLRNVEALPEVLAGTLKQFFERISEQ